MDTKSIFQNVAEATAAAHRKNAALLVKVALKDSSFNDDFLHCVYRLVQAKKEVSLVDKMMKFLSLFFTAIKESEKNDQIMAFLSTVMFQKLLKGATAGNKTVRFRSCQLLSVLMNSLDELKFSFLMLVMTFLSLYAIYWWIE